jgi:hypothetical protein
MRGLNVYWQARIAAQLRDCGRAVRFLEDARSKGNPYGNAYSHMSFEVPEFAKLQKSCGPFQRFMAPKKGADDR